MAKNRKRPAPDGDENVDMSPMIDLVFLLLIFFLVNANMITVEMDKKVEVPIAKASQPVETKNGRIVINVYEEGDIKDSTTKLIFDGENDLIDYIKSQKEISDALGFKPKLHLRGDRKSLFRHARKVINAAAKAGVDDVRFAAYVVADKY